MIKRLLLAFLIVTTSITTVLADGPDLPCDMADPDGTACPIDTWVVLFAAIAVIATVVHLRRKEKHASLLQ